MLATHLTPLQALGLEVLEVDPRAEPQKGFEPAPNRLALTQRTSKTESSRLQLAFYPTASPPLPRT